MMDVVIVVSIKVAKAGCYVGIFEIYDEDGNVLESFEKRYAKKPIHAVSYNIGCELWGRVKQHDDWLPINLSSDFLMNIPDWVSRKISKALEAEKNSRLVDLGRLETEEIGEDMSLFYGSEHE
jgi:hypothetical protein